MVLTCKMYVKTIQNPLLKTEDVEHKVPMFKFCKNICHFVFRHPLWWFFLFFLIFRLEFLKDEKNSGLDFFFVATNFSNTGINMA